MFRHFGLLGSISAFLLATFRISQKPGACFRRKHVIPKWIASFGIQSLPLSLSVSNSIKWLSALWRYEGVFADVW